MPRCGRAVGLEEPERRIAHRRELGVGLPCLRALGRHLVHVGERERLRHLRHLAGFLRRGGCGREKEDRRMRQAMSGASRRIFSRCWASAVARSSYNFWNPAKKRRQPATASARLLASPIGMAMRWMMPCAAPTDGAWSDVEVAHAERVGLDERPPRLDLLAHERREDLVGRDGVLDLHAQQACAPWGPSWFPTAARDSSRPGPCSAAMAVASRACASSQSSASLKRLDRLLLLAALDHRARMHDAAHYVRRRRG